MRDTIDMAREAGMTGLEAGGLFDNFLVFEALVRADERERVMNEPLTKAQWQRFEDEIRADERNRTWTQEHWTEYERSIAAVEREACAKVCEEYETNNDITATWLNIVAEAIRARSKDEK